MVMNLLKSIQTKYYSFIEIDAQDNINVKFKILCFICRKSINCHCLLTDKQNYLVTAYGPFYFNPENFPFLRAHYRNPGRFEIRLHILNAINIGKEIILQQLFEVGLQHSL